MKNIKKISSEDLLQELIQKEVVMPLFVKDKNGNRIVISQIEDSKPTFILSAKEAQSLKEQSGFDKHQKLYTRFEGVDLEVMETKWSELEYTFHKVR